MPPVSSQGAIAAKNGEEGGSRSGIDFRERLPLPVPGGAYGWPSIAADTGSLPAAEPVTRDNGPCRRTAAARLERVAGPRSL
ncbi:hypothetical protein GCM10009789_24000 [Kribbella sancticallisti]|uniref:Uncharacterized protein n=1 Tax=Kribbella sancticallisti TaxID=460087 RepID=A0ABN2D3G3_9ACTN